MIRRILEKKIRDLPKSVLLLGPRQVGKSTLLGNLEPDLIINLAKEDEYLSHLKDPGLIQRLVEARSSNKVILIDEIQRVPSLLNTTQALIDADKSRKFLMTGSSARKLKRGDANLLPGRIFTLYLTPLSIWELGENFELDTALSKGLLPEIYLQDYGAELLGSYTESYLREEVQAEALTKNLAAYARFLDLSAEVSGQHLNYSKLASDAEINKETIRRYFDILCDTLIVERIRSFKEVDSARRARQKERFIFFDLGVRNALQGRHRTMLSKEEYGSLFEQFIILQCLSYKRCHDSSWKISTYLDANGVDVDLIIETDSKLICVEVKKAKKPHAKMFKNLRIFSSLVKKPTKNYLLYCGGDAQKFDDGLALPYQEFLLDVLPGI